MTDSFSRAERGQRFLALMKRYCIDYVNVGDQSVTRDLMVEDYVLRMGPHRVTGRDTAYWQATAKQMRQYPGLMLTVHEIATDGDRLTMRFSEHGRRAKDGKYCAWGGIALYRWNGERLTQCHVEQDYLSRIRQIESGVPDKVDHPAPAPFRVDVGEPDAAAEQVVRDWLQSGAIGRDPRVLCDEAWQTGNQAPVLDQHAIEIIDLFSVGGTVAFHVRQSGPVSEAFPAGTPGEQASLYSAGIVHVAGGEVESGRIIRNRIELTR